MELTVRLLVSHALLFAAVLLPPSTTTTQALEGIPSLSSLRGNGRQPLSREEELMKALQFLEEYERNLGDTWDDEGEADWQTQGYPYMQMDDMEDEDIVPWDELEEEDDGADDNVDLNLFLRNLLQGASKNRNSAVVPDAGYYTPQRSSFNNQYVLFSPVDNEADLEDEITLDVAIEKLKARQKEEQLWEDIIGDMLAEEILEMDARDEIQELMDVKEEEDELDAILEGEEDTIFEEEDPWEDVESEGEEESDVVPWSWASPEWDVEDEGAVSSSIEEEFDPESSSEEDNEIDPDAAVLLLEEMLAEEEEKQRQEEEQRKLLEMVLGENSEEEEEDDLYNDDSATEDAIENYFKALIENTAEDEAIFDQDSEEAMEENEESESDEEPEAWWNESAFSQDEQEGEEIIQDYGESSEEEEGEEEVDYNQLVQEITNEIEAAAEEVEQEVVAALKERLLEENMKYLEEEPNEEEEEEEEEEELVEPYASNEIDDVNAAEVLANMLANYQQQQKEKRTGLSSCPIQNLVDDCAFIDSFNDVDSDGTYRNKFKRACNRHQLCYTCGGQFDIEINLCDEVFDAEMLADCGDDKECVQVADQFSFIAINTHSRSDSPPPQCQAKCLLPFLIKD